MMHDPIYVTKPLLPTLEQYNEKLALIWEKQWLTNNGTLCLALQDALKKRMQVDQLELFVNGHLALDIAIRALELKGEVITTPFTFASTTHALVLNGIKPVFCDIHAEDYTLDENRLEALITPETSAILPVHVYGYPCHTKAIQAVADRHGLKVLYDAAHTFDVTVHGKSIAAEGDVSMLSFHATKVFNTIEGGALVFKDEKIAAKTRALRNFGIAGPESVPDIGLNAKLNEFAAAMGLCNLELVTDAIARRGEQVRRYRERLGNLRGLRLMDYDRMVREGIRTNYAYMPLEVDDAQCGFTRDELFDALAEKQVFTRKYFYPLVTDYECYASIYGNADIPVARSAARNTLTLPISGTTTLEEIDYVCDGIAELHEKRNR